MQLNEIINSLSPTELVKTGIDYLDDQTGGGYERPSLVAINCIQEDAGVKCLAGLFSHYFKHNRPFSTMPGKKAAVIFFGTKDLSEFISQQAWIDIQANAQANGFNVYFLNMFSYRLAWSVSGNVDCLVEYMEKIEKEDDCEFQAVFINRLQQFTPPRTPEQSEPGFSIILRQVRQKICIQKNITAFTVIGFDDTHLKREIKQMGGTAKEVTDFINNSPSKSIYEVDHVLTVHQINESSEYRKLMFRRGKCRAVVRTIKNPPPFTCHVSRDGNVVDLIPDDKPA